MVPKLNDDQRMLVEENIPLIRWYLKTRVNYIPEGQYEDFFQMGAYGLCKAAATFKPQKGTRFSTYAYFCIANEIRMHLRKEQTREYERLALRLEDTAPETRGAVLAECIPAAENVDAVLALMDLEAVIARCAVGRDRTILKLYAGGYSQEQIARRVRISQPLVSRRIKVMRAEIAEQLRREA